jgi:hypothetical protein
MSVLSHAKRLGGLAGAWIELSGDPPHPKILIQNGLDVVRLEPAQAHVLHEYLGHVLSGMEEPPC